MKLILVISLLTLLTTALHAQAAHGFQPGQTISWQDRVSGKWQSGTYIGATPGDKQPIIQQRPGEPGSQTAYEWDKISKTPPPAPAAAPANAAAIPPLPLPMNPGANVPPLPLPANNNIPAQPQANNGPPPGPNGPPLTEEDIKAWLAQKLPGNPFADSPYLQQVNKELGELVKQRGTTFTDLKKLNDENILGRYGLNSDATGPMTHNYGPPNKKEELYGQWETNKIGLPTHAVVGDYYVTTLELAKAKTGTVTINPDHSYIWDTGTGVIQGRWEDAKPDEMADQGGAGVILKGAKSGVDWVAFKYRAGTKEEWLGLAEVNRRSVRESAARIQ